MNSNSVAAFFIASILFVSANAQAQQSYYGYGMQPGLQQCSNNPNQTAGSRNDSDSSDAASQLSRQLAAQLAKAKVEKRHLEAEKRTYEKTINKVFDPHWAEAFRQHMDKGMNCTPRKRDPASPPTPAPPPGPNPRCAYGELANGQCAPVTPPPPPPPPPPPGPGKTDPPISVEPVPNPPKPPAPPVDHKCTAPDTWSARFKRCVGPAKPASDNRIFSGGRSIASVGGGRAPAAAEVVGAGTSTSGGSSSATAPAENEDSYWSSHPDTGSRFDYGSNSGGSPTLFYDDRAPYNRGDWKRICVDDGEINPLACSDNHYWATAKVDRSDCEDALSEYRQHVKDIDEKEEQIVALKDKIKLLAQDAKDLAGISREDLESGGCKKCAEARRNGGGSNSGGRSIAPLVAGFVGGGLLEFLSYASDKSSYNQYRNAFNANQAQATALNSAEGWNNTASAALPFQHQFGAGVGLAEMGLLSYASQGNSQGGNCGAMNQFQNGVPGMNGMNFANGGAFMNPGLQNQWGNGQGGIYNQGYGPGFTNPALALQLQGGYNPALMGGYNPALAQNPALLAQLQGGYNPAYGQGGYNPLAINGGVNLNTGINPAFLQNGYSAQGPFGANGQYGAGNPMDEYYRRQYDTNAGTSALGQSLAYQQQLLNQKIGLLNQGALTGSNYGSVYGSSYQPSYLSAGAYLNFGINGGSNGYYSPSYSQYAAPYTTSISPYYNNGTTSTYSTAPAGFGTTSGTILGR